MSSFLSFLLSGARPSFFYGLRIPIIQPFYSVLTSIYNHSGAKSEWAASIRRARIVIRKMCKMQWWFWTVILMVFLNTCTVAVEHYNQPQWLTEFLCKQKQDQLEAGFEAKLCWPCLKASLSQFLVQKWKKRKDIYYSIQCLNSKQTFQF